MGTYDIIAREVRKYWAHTCVQDVIVFFQQKFEWEKDWEHIAVYASPYSSDDAETVCFQWDFCEGQTETRSIRIISFDEAAEIIEGYMKWREWRERDEQEEV